MYGYRFIHRFRDDAGQGVFARPGGTVVSLRLVITLSLGLITAGLAAACGGGGGGGPEIIVGPQRPLVDRVVSESAGTLSVEVGRFGGDTGAISVRYVTADQTATEGLDYARAEGVLDWAAGDGTPKVILIPILNDALLEEDEQFWVVLSDPMGGTTICSEERYLIEIEDDEEPAPGTPGSGGGSGGGSGSGGTGPGLPGGSGAGPCDPSNPDCSMITFEFSRYLATEDEGTIQLRVLRRGAAAGVVEVDVDVSGGSATEGLDSDPVLTRLTWASGDTVAKLVSVTIKDDTQPEPDETLILAFFNPTRTGGACVETCNALTLTIQDDDGPGAILVVEELCVQEDAGIAQLPVYRVGGTRGVVGVSYSTSDGTATAPADYGSASGTLTWADGDDAVKFIDISIVKDAVTDLLETFAVGFSAPTGGVALSATTMEVSIIQGRVFSRVSATRVDECDGCVELTLIVRCDSIGPGDGITYSTESGTATAGTDFVADAGMAIVDFDGTATVYIEILDDALIEGDETFVIKTGTIGSTGVTVTILDDDPNGTVECDVSMVRYEEQAGARKLRVVRGPCSSGAVSVDWVLVDGSALLGSDYGAPALSGTFTWAVGDLTDRFVDITILNDALLEGVEDFYLRLSNPMGADMGTVPETRVDIIDDDGPGCVAFL